MQTIIATEPSISSSYSDLLYVLGLVFGVPLTVEYLGNVWSCMVVKRFAEKGSFLGRLDWHTRFFSFLDFVVIVTFWVETGYETQEYETHITSGTSRVLKALRNLRLFRLVRIVEVFNTPHVKKAFRVLYRVLERKADDLYAALSVSFISLIFIATIMYLIEGREHKGFDSFQSIPVAMYWGVITITTIGYGDIYPKTSLGQAFCCFVGFYAVCIGSIPVGIIGSGYVEELENEREEARRLAAGQPSSGEVTERIVSLRELLGDLSSPTVLGSMHTSELETYHRLLKQSIGSVDDFLFQEALAHRPPFTGSAHETRMTAGIQ